MEISSDSSGPAEGGDPAADDTAATRRSPRLETPPGFPPRPSSPPPRPAAVDSGAETAGAEPGGAETEGEGSGGAATGGAVTRGAGSGGAATGGAASPSGGGAVGDPAGGPGAGQPPQPDQLETLSPQAIRAWIVRRGSPGGGGYGPAGAGAACPGGTAGAGGAGGTAGGTGGAAGAGGTGAASPGGTGGATGAGGTGAAAGAGGTGDASARGAAGAGGAGGTGGAGGAAGAGGTGDARAGGAAGAGGAGGAGAASAGGAAGAGGARDTSAGGAGAGQPPQPDLLETLSPQAIRAWIVRRGSPGGGGYGPAGARATRPRGTAGAGGAGGTAGGAAGAGGTRGAAGAGGTGAAAGAGGTGVASAGGAAGAGGAGGTGGAGGAAGAGGTGAASAGGAAGGGGAGGAGAASAGGAGGAGATTAGGAGAASARGTAGTGGAGSAGALRHLLGLPPAPTEFPVAVTTPPLLFPHLLPHSPLRAPAPYTAVTEASVPARVRRVRRPHAPAVPGTHDMTLRPSSVPQRVVLPSPPASSLPDIADPPSGLARASSPTVTRLLATVVMDPTFSSPAASALVAELVDFAAAHRLDYLASLVSDPDPACPPSVGGEVALGCDVLEDRQEELECLAAAAPHLVTMLLAPEGDPDALDIPTPRSYREVISGEMASWKSTGTYVDEVPPPGANIVSGMWIFRVKRPPGSPTAFKARYVARGFSHREGVDFFQTFSPTPKMTTLRVLLHVAAQRDYELHSLDFSTAFLQGSLHEAICLRRPQAFTGSFPEGTQWSLRRPVYGLRQAPREWHDTLRTTLAALGFAPSTADPSLFLRTDTTLPAFYILVYVDDLVFATADTEALALVKAELQERHTCIDLGELRSYLGLQITRDRARRTITLTQSHMVHQVLQRFGFQYSSPQPTPLSTGHSFLAPPSDESVEPSGPYPELVGCLMYLMTCTRPDLAYPLSLLARYVAPGRHRKVHWDAAKRVLRYLCSTSGMGLVLGGRGSVVLTGHADASWADDQATQRSSQGYTFSLGSGSVSWRSTCSSSVLGSSCEAEIYAGAMAAQELRWLTYLLTDLGERPRSPPVLYVDNKAMLALCREQRPEHRTKHIALRYFLAHELQQRGQLRLAYVASRSNTADVFTKALGSGDHQRFCTALGLVPTLPHLLVA
ncbi:unnamed protein product [Closterium sp. Naga37s-1]|nr:unnamed protein product [Closterium sp. Naga37s-1]